MTTANVTPAGSRPRPVLVAQSILAAAGLVVGTAGFAEQVPARAAWWIVTGIAAVNLGLGFYLQSRVTPLSDPRASDGTPLAPVPEILERLGDAPAPQSATPLKYTPGGVGDPRGRPDV